MSEKTKKALRILIDNPDIAAMKFAELMWGDSKKWNKSYNTGNGATRGKGMWLCAGSYLAKLQNRGLVYRDFSGGHSTFRVSAKGKSFLAESGAE